MAKGDIVLITFPFTNLTGSKLRPAIVLVETNLDITVCFVTTQINWQEPTDIVLLPNDKNGIKKQSLVRISKIATIDKSLVQGLLGRLSENDIIDLNSKLKVLFQL
ncbi:MAG TPA: type II toxin-antitoxin system PemK/MazF family toxin [Chitinophagales bacterium]|nr:type II toxin-antitoxin system PemK/MazF family toxin [Chitinophagales bacterium]